MPPIQRPELCRPRPWPAMASTGQCESPPCHVRSVKGGADAASIASGPLVRSHSSGDVGVGEAEVGIGHRERTAEPAHAVAVIVDPYAEAPGDLFIEQRIDRGQLACASSQSPPRVERAARRRARRHQQAGEELGDASGAAVPVDRRDLRGPPGRRGWRTRRRAPPVGSRSRARRLAVVGGISPRGRAPAPVRGGRARGELEPPRRATSSRRRLRRAPVDPAHQLAAQVSVEDRLLGMAAAGGSNHGASAASSAHSRSQSSNTS